MNQQSVEEEEKEPHRDEDMIDSSAVKFKPPYSEVSDKVEEMNMDDFMDVHER